MLYTLIWPPGSVVGCGSGPMLRCLDADWIKKAVTIGGRVTGQKKETEGVEAREGVKKERNKKGEKEISVKGWKSERGRWSVEGWDEWDGWLIQGHDEISGCIVGLGER